jgi:hypothetical protein
MDRAFLKFTNWSRLTTFARYQLLLYYALRFGKSSGNFQVMERAP